MKQTSKMPTNKRRAKTLGGRGRGDHILFHRDADRSGKKQYQVGPGKPPREFQFRPGVSGNPTGIKGKKRSRGPDIKAMLERALSKKTKQGGRDQPITKGAAGIDKLVDDFAAGNHHARRDLISLAGKVGVDLTAGRTAEIERALGTTMPTNDQAMVDDYVRRRSEELQHNDEPATEAGNTADVRSTEQRDRDQ